LLKDWDTSIAILVFSRSRGMMDVVVVVNAGPGPDAVIDVGGGASTAAEVDVIRASFSKASFTNRL
jgi:hypothetical protein